MKKENRTIPTPSQVETLMSDWLGNLRSGASGDHVHKGSGGIRTQKTYTDYVIGDITGLSDLETIRKGREAAKRVVAAIVSRPVEVNVGGNNSFHTRTEGVESITLATDYFDDTSIGKREKVDILLGLASHEAAHSVFTESGKTEGHLEGLPGDIATLKHQIWNTIEDERIEYLLGDERPGLSDCLGATKNYFFKRLVKQFRANGEMPKEPVPKLLAAFSQAVRYPSEMQEQDVIDNFDELDSIRRILTPFPLTADDCWDATERIMDLIRDTVKKDMQDKKPDNTDGQPSGGGPGEGESAPQGGDSQQPEGGRQPSGSDAGPTDQEVQKALQKALGTNEGKRVLEAMKKDNDKGSGKNAAQVLSDGDCARFANEDGAECESPGGHGNPSFFIFKPRGESDPYNACKRRINSLIPAMSHALACKSEEQEYILQGMPAGKLNTNKLASLKVGNKTIFSKSGSVRCSSASVCLLIDESGSMDGEKKTCTRDAAVLVNEAVARIKNVNFYCYGFTTDRLNVYSEGGKTSKWSLSATEARGGTPTGKAMKMCAERVRRFSRDQCLMLVMTDGNADDNAAVITQDEVLRKKGFYPIGIGILSSSVSRTFKDYVVLQDIKKMPFSLGKLTKKYLNKILVKNQ